MASNISIDERRLGRTPKQDAEGNIYSKGTLPANGILSSATVGSALVAATPAATGVQSGTFYSIETDAASVALTDPAVTNYVFAKYVVTQAGVSTFTLTATAMVGLGVAGTDLDLIDGHIGDYVQIMGKGGDTAEADPVFFVVECRGNWTVS